ncbi:hypothetical protein NC661_00195 [Aquibacillus koreensis]|uniref:Metallo-beta-lactamase domain-containing protein n=1 Tax=Aquibacillus koreensis TaxID=279446 RepID=A0A9X3WHP4_9BACI|nr:MBL fold metallo-hydrolase [Aquibacillus koreensis]MCT2537357.1 hypothetical protein [Aquibacillus koreensis]MDC3418803.1 hypothetical protein [Aquibacillus koreensis]
MKQKVFIWIGIFLWISAGINIVNAESINLLEEGELYVAFLNLPDGEATLIKTSNDRNYLINTGSNESEEKLLFQLKELEIKQLDGLILTGQTNDYCGNAHRLIERYHINKTYYSSDLSSTCKEQLTSTSRVQWKSGEVISLDEHLTVQVLAVGPKGDMSLGISYGENSIMYLSISDVENEKEILDTGFKSNILKIGNYAKGKSPSLSFLEKIDPHMSIVFNSKGYTPNEGLIERLNESWVDVYYLKQAGTTIIRMDLHEYEILS